MRTHDVPGMRGEALADLLAQQEAKHTAPLAEAHYRLALEAMLARVSAEITEEAAARRAAGGNGAA